MVGLKTYQKELETKIIFMERDKENRERDIEIIEKKIAEMMVKLEEINRLSEQSSVKVN